ncbi:hypothetical protein ACF0H5_015790 [Mactra antiquata]
MRRLFQLCTCMIFVLLIPVNARFFEIRWQNTTDINRLSKNKDFRDKCIVSVRACKTSTCSAPQPNATVYVLTRNGTNDYLGYDLDQTDTNGRACVLTACDHKAYMFVRSKPDQANDFELMFTSNISQSLPTGYAYTVSQMSQLMDFVVIDRGTTTIKGVARAGPTFETYDECQKAKSSDYSFDYYFIGQQESLVTNKPINSHNNELSWYYVDPRRNTYQSCFLKLAVKSNSPKPVVATLVSTDTSGNLYGTYTVGAKTLPSARDQSLKAACVEFRCPVHDERGQLKHTNVTGSVSLIDNRSVDCKISSGNIKMRYSTTNGTHFSVSLQADENYGSFYGIYSHRDREVAKAMCLTGHNFLFPSFDMNVQLNTFASYSCTKASVLIGK